MAAPVGSAGAPNLDARGGAPRVIHSLAISGPWAAAQGISEAKWCPTVLNPQKEPSAHRPQALSPLNPAAAGQLWLTGDVHRTQTPRM